MITEERELSSAILSRSNATAISVQRLFKSYGSKEALRGVSFEVQRGTIFALLGPNGAGKTTTIEILEGYRPRDSGDVHVLGMDPATDSARIKPRVGVMLQQGGIYPQLRPLEVLRLFASFYANPESPEELIERVGLRDALKTRYRHLSGGQQQRLSLALALVGRPELVFLDEPTTGMDPQARRSTWGLIRGLREQGVTVVLTTHFMDEAEHLADQVAIVNHGTVIALGTPAELVASTGSSQVRLRTSAPIAEDRARLTLSFPLQSGSANNYVIDVVPSPAVIAELTRWLEAEGILIAELRVGNPSLEEAFLELTQDGGEGQ
jgi:ABC-2 type transport system ATP-binding protein